MIYKSETPKTTDQLTLSLMERTGNDDLIIGLYFDYLWVNHNEGF